MSKGHMSVHCIELLQMGVQGPLGYVRVYVHGLLHTWGLVRCIEHGNAKPYLLINNFYNKRLY